MMLVGCDFLIVLLCLVVFLLMIIMHCFDFVCGFACLFWVLFPVVWILFTISCCFIILDFGRFCWYLWSVQLLIVGLVCFVCDFCVLVFDYVGYVDCVGMGCLFVIWMTCCLGLGVVLLIIVLLD